MIPESDEIILDGGFTPVQKKILQALEEKHYMTRGELMNQLKIPRTTIYKHLVDLMSYNLIKKGIKKPFIKGRQPVYFVLVKPNENSHQIKTF